jgi:hypothetical protein
LSTSRCPHQGPQTSLVDNLSWVATSFSNTYLAKSILDIHEVVWISIHCLSRRAAYAKVHQVFSNSECIVSPSINFLLR